jgi:hypothetical protein
LDIELVTWHVLGRRQWAECYDSARALIGRTISVDVRELDMLRPDEEFIWHDTDESACAAEDMLGLSPFSFAAMERLIAQGIAEPFTLAGESYADSRRVSLESDDMDEPSPQDID